MARGRQRDTDDGDFLNEPLGEDVLGASKPSLKPDSLDGADSTVVTIKGVEKVKVPDDERDEGYRMAVRLDFEETDLPYWPNKTGLRSLSERYGAKPGDWIGEPIALVVVRVNNPRTGRPQPALHVAQGEEFDELVGMSKRRTRRKPVATKRARAKK